MAHGSTKAVLTAIVANGIVTIVKFIAGTLGGSASMMNEAVHSLMDTLNQGFLYLGLREGYKPADHQYAFGHGQKKYLWNLWSAIGLFSIGAGLGLAHAWHSWHLLGHKETVEQVMLLGHEVSVLALNLSVLAIGLVLEGYSFLVALKEYLLRMRAEGESNPFTYLAKADDPTLVAVVLEDSAAMLGLALAALGIILTAVTGHGEYDIIFSALIAFMLGSIAFYLGWTNMRFLADVRDKDAEQVFREVVAAHDELENLHDVRSIVIDESRTVLVAEIELREEAVTRGLCSQISERRDEILNTVPSVRRQEESVRDYATARSSIETVLTRTEQIVDEVEAEVKQRLARVEHITLEVQGIAEAPDTEQAIRHMEEHHA